MKKNWLLLVVIIIATEATGSLSGVLAGDIRTKYEAFNQIFLAPPGSVFGIVWPLLYLLMAIAFYRALINCSTTKTKELLLVYLVQLALNFSWSLVFFGGDLLKEAILIIVVLIAVVTYQIRLFRQVDRLSGNLLIPYWLWLIFALYLNVGFALVN